MTARIVVRVGILSAALALAGCATRWNGLPDASESIGNDPLSGLPVRFQQSGLELGGVTPRPIAVDSLTVGRYSSICLGECEFIGDSAGNVFHR